MRTERSHDDDAAAAAVPLVQEEEGWASISANEVSDDEDPDPQLIVPGDESANTNSRTADSSSTSIHLSTSSIDLSQIDILAIADSLIPPEDIGTTMDDNQTMKQDEMDQYGEDDVLSEDEDASPSHAFASRVKSLLARNQKAIVLLAVSTVLLAGCIAGAQVWNRHSERVAFLEGEVQRLQEIERKAQELEKSRAWWAEHEQSQTGRELADNCYFHAGLGECTKNMMADWNEKVASAYKTFENVAWSWDHESEQVDETDSEEHAPMNELSLIGADAFSEVVDAVSHSMEAAGDVFTSFWNEVSAVTEESLQFVAKEFSVDRVQEFTRETLDDATAYTRPEE